MPCAYPSENIEGCLRDERLAKPDGLDHVPNLLPDGCKPLDECIAEWEADYKKASALASARIDLMFMLASGRLNQRIEESCEEAHKELKLRTTLALVDLNFKADRLYLQIFFGGGLYHQKG